MIKIVKITTLLVIVSALFSILSAVQVQVLKQFVDDNGIVYDLINDGVHDYGTLNLLYQGTNSLPDIVNIESGAFVELTAGESYKVQVVAAQQYLDLPDDVFPDVIQDIKHQHWNNNEDDFEDYYLVSDPVPIMPDGTRLRAQFYEPKLLNLSSTDNIPLWFNDPWFVNNDGSQGGFREVSNGNFEVFHNSNTDQPKCEVKVKRLIANQSDIYWLYETISSGLEYFYYDQSQITLTEGYETDDYYHVVEVLYNSFDGEELQVNYAPISSGYYVNIIVRENEALSIPSGADILFGTEVHLSVIGTLKLMGTSEAEIFLSTLQSASHTIFINPNASLDLQYVTFNQNVSLTYTGMFSYWQGAIDTAQDNTINIEHLTTVPGADLWISNVEYAPGCETVFNISNSELFHLGADFSSQPISVQNCIITNNFYINNVVGGLSISGCEFPNYSQIIYNNYSSTEIFSNNFWSGNMYDKIIFHEELVIENVNYILSPHLADEIAQVDSVQLQYLAETHLANYYDGRPDDVIALMNNTIINGRINYENSIINPDLPIEYVLENNLMYAYSGNYNDHFIDIDQMVNADVEIFNNDYNLYWDDYGFDGIMETFSNTLIQSGENSLFEPPLLINPEIGDYTYHYNSPCIDAGNPDNDDDGESWDEDLDDQDADGTRLDIGAFYFHQFLNIGDPTMDNLIDVSDVLAIVQHILSDYELLTILQAQNADINQDTWVDILDIISIINLILADPIENDEQEGVTYITLTTKQKDNPPFVMEVQMLTEITVDGMQMQIDLDPGYKAVSLERGAFAVDTGMTLSGRISEDSTSVKFLYYGLEGQKFPVGEGRLLDIGMIYEGLAKNPEHVVAGHFSETLSTSNGSSFNEVRIVDSNEYASLVEKFDNQNAALPTTFTLHPAYPNPFNPVTELSFDLPEDSKVSLQVFDLQGRLVAELVNGSMSAGSHSVQWDAKGLSSAMYIVKLNAGRHSAEQKITLIK